MFLKWRPSFIFCPLFIDFDALWKAVKVRSTSEVNASSAQLCLHSEVLNSKKNNCRGKWCEQSSTKLN